MSTSKEIINWISLVLLGLTVCISGIGQIVPVEFGESGTVSVGFAIITLPILVVLSLNWTLKKQYSVGRKIITILLTGLGSVLVFFASITMLFAFPSGSWQTEYVYYQNKTNSKHIICRQAMDCGQIHCLKHRKVEIRPVLKYWNIVTQPENSAELNEWISVDKQAGFNCGTH